MSEDAYPTFQSAGQAGLSGIGLAEVVLVADSAATASIITVAGWPADRIGTTRQPLGGSAQIHAFDWRNEVAGEHVLTALPADCAILCLVSMATVDRADVLLGGFDAYFVFGDSPALIAGGLAELSRTLSLQRAHDSASDERARLHALATELARLADQLGQITTGDSETGTAALADRSLSYQAEPSARLGGVVPPDARRIRALIQMRRLRDRFFDGGLFADPAWDMLLDLAASRLEGRSVSVSSLCIAAAVPPTTALRWIRLMTDQNLLMRRADPVDARRMFIDLSDDAFEQLCSWFALVEERGGVGV